MAQPWTQEPSQRRVQNMQSLQDPENSFPEFSPRNLKPPLRMWENVRHPTTKLLLCDTGQELLEWGFSRNYKTMKVEMTKVPSTTNWHLPSTSTRIKSWTHCSSWSSTSPWKELMVKIRNKALCALEKTARTSLQIDIFRRWFYEPSSCISSYLEKH